MVSLRQSALLCLVFAISPACTEDGANSAVNSNSGKDENPEEPDAVPEFDAGGGGPSSDDDDEEPAPEGEPDAFPEPAPEPTPPDLTPVPVPEPPAPVEPDVAEPEPSDGDDLLPPDAGPPDEAEPQPGPEPQSAFDAMNDPVENDIQCPEEEPFAGDTCPAYSLVCKYGSEVDCRSRWVCSGDGSWSLNYGPRDCPEVCPEAEPVEGELCEVESAVCDYGDSAQCRAQWLCFEERWARTFYGDCSEQTTCPEAPPETGEACTLEEFTPMGDICIYEGGALCACSCYWEGEVLRQQWSCNIVTTGFPPSYLTACPKLLPEVGSDCDETNTSTCGYVTAEECAAPGTGTTLANCVDGQWTHSTP
jgi:hypothetical protein